MSSFRFTSLYIAFSAIGLLAGANRISAAAVSAATPGLQSTQAYSQALNECLALCSTRDYVRAESLLFATNHQPSGSLEWQLEAAGKLVQVGLWLRERYDIAGAQWAADRALAVLEGAKGQSASKAKQQTQRDAEIFEWRGFIAERFQHDDAAAKAEYQNALRINPSSARAKEGLAQAEARLAKHERVNQRAGSR